MRLPPSRRELQLAHSSPAGFALAASGIPTGGVGWWMYRLQRVINSWLVDIAAGRKRYVILTAPPRHGKSMLVAQWLPAWWLGHHPDHEVAIASHTSELAEEHGGIARDIMLAHGERYFGLRVRGGQKSAANGWQIEGRRGRLHAIGKGGTFTGKGANLLIVDDPIKDQAEAYSPTQRESLWKWWTGVAHKRLNPGGSSVLIMFTRWHEDDLVGRLLERDKDRGRWAVLNIPAIAEANDPVGRETGEALWSEMLDGSPAYPLEDLEVMRDEDPIMFQAQHQGNPRPPEGRTFTRAHFKYARDQGTYFDLVQADGSVRHVTKAECDWIGTSDFATGKGQANDYCAFLVAAITPRRELIIVDVGREKLGLGEQWEWMKRRWRGFPHLYESGDVGIEWNQGGQACWGMCEGEVARGEWPHMLEKFHADGDKVRRATSATNAYKNGRIYHLDLGAHWVGPFEREMLNFPAGKYDDQVDCLSYAAMRVDAMGGSADMVERGPDGEIKRSWTPAEESAAAADPVDEEDEFALVASPPAAAAPKRQRRGRGGLFR